MRSYRYCILLTCFAGFACLQMLAQSPSLTVERRGNQLHVAAPQLHFLEGKPLERLNNGASVTYTLALTLTAGSSATVRQQERFILSYDLWEEKFSVVQAGSPGRSASHLTAAAAESWCLDSLQLPLPVLSPEKSFTVKLECSYVDSESASGESSSGLTLAGLIEVFSRKKREEPLHWEALSGPLRLMDMKQNASSGRRTLRAPGA
jgi:hypothetical protein